MGDAIKKIGDDGLARRMAAGMVIISPFGAALGVAAGPRAAVYRVDSGAVGIIFEWVARQQVPQRLRVHAPAIQGGVEAAPAPAVDRREAQVGR